MHFGFGGGLHLIDAGVGGGDLLFNLAVGFRLHPGDFFKVLDAILPDTDVSSFRARFDTLTSKKRGEALRDGFASLLTGFVSGTARKLGGQAVNNLIGIPDIG